MEQPDKNMMNNKELIEKMIEDLENVDHLNDASKIRIVVDSVLKRKINLDQQTERAASSQLTALQQVGEAFGNAGNYPDDTADQHRMDKRNCEQNLSNKIFALDDKSSDDCRVLGISYDSRNNVYTSYMSDVPRYVSPDHAHGKYLGAVLSRGATSNGVDRTIPLFPSSITSDEVPFGSKRNDGSVIAVSYKFNHRNDMGTSNPTIQVEPGRVSFQRVTQPTLLTAQDVSNLLGSEALGNHNDQSVSDGLSEIMHVANPQPFDEERRHFTQIHRQFLAFKSERMKCCTGTEQKERYDDLDETTTTSVSVAFSDAGSNSKNRKSQTLKVRSVNVFEAQQSVASELFKEIRIVTNHAIGLFCQKNGLPIVFRGPRKCLDGDDRDKRSGTFRKWYPSPIRNAEAGIHVYAPSTNSVNSSLDYINQYLLHEHLKLIEPPSMRYGRGVVCYRTDTSELDYMSFLTNVYQGGIVRFLEIAFGIIDSMETLNEMLKKKLLQLVKEGVL